jgi:death-on-curing family protein
MNDCITYLSEEDFDFIFEKIQEISISQGGELAPQYQSELLGKEKLFALSESLKNEHYATILEKASFFFLSIAKNHLFTNGNKRLSVFCLIYFLWKNGAEFKTADFKKIEKIISHLVLKPSGLRKVQGNFKFENNEIYIEKLAKLVVENSQNLSFDEQKKMVENAFTCLVK